MDELVRVSNGAKAIHIASEHFARVEQELEASHLKLDEIERERNILEGRIAELNEALNRAEQRANTWELKATAIAQSLLDASAVLVQGGREAQGIIGEVRHGQVETAAEELRTNGGGG